MSDSEDDLFNVATTASDASALVSKWLEDSDEENDVDSGPEPTPVASNTTLTRVEGVGLGAEDLNDLVAQRRLDPTERKMKYRMEASAKWKEEREKEALALAKRIEDDVFDDDSRSAQLSKKRNRAFGKNSVVDLYTTSKKKKKIEETPKPKANVDVIFESVQKVENEVIFDFSSPKPSAETEPTTEKKPQDDSSNKSGKPRKDGSSSKDKHKKSKSHNHSKHKSKSSAK